jgi:hypothetical protein
MSSRIPSPLITLLKGSLFENERVIWQGRPDAWTDMMMMIRVFWWIGPPWLAITVLGIQQGWIDENAMFFLWTGVMMLVGPIALYITDLQTLFVITDRRALILRTAWFKRTVVSSWYEQIAKLDVYMIKDQVGHLEFISPTPNEVRHEGFRCVKQVEKVRELLQRTLRG